MFTLKNAALEPDKLMYTYISLLRGINVSGQKKMRMAELRILFESLEFNNIETYLQSGNVVFDAAEAEFSTLAELIELQIENHFRFKVPVSIYGADDFRRIISNNPFLNDRRKDPAKLFVTFLNSLPLEAKLSDFVTPSSEAAEFLIMDKEIFLFCPNGYGRTKLTNNFFEKELDVTATTRNWKTVNTLYNLAKNR